MKIFSQLLLLFLLTNLNVIGVYSKVCPRDYHLHRDVCFSVSTNRQNWGGARSQCQRGHGDLISIHDQSLYNHIKGYVKIGHENSAWIGASDIAKEGQFVWVDAKRFTETSWWSSVNPNNHEGNENCVNLLNDGTYFGLNDYNCANVILFICEARGCGDIEFCQTGYQMCTHNNNTCSRCVDNKVFYKPIKGDTECGKMCSWNDFYCWPGSCTDELVAGCACASGFHKNTTSTGVFCQSSFMSK